MAPSPAPIQEPIAASGGRLSPIWARWFDAMRRELHRAPSYKKANLPIGEVGDTVYVLDESGGAVLAFYDGTNWRRVTDRAIVS